MYDEQNVDVTNVVMGQRFMEVEDPVYNSTNGTRGYILKEAYDIPDEEHAAEMNVVTWSIYNGSYWDVWFRVFVDGAPAGNGNLMVDKPNAYMDAIHPVVSAWMDQVPEEGEFLVVEIVYQLNRIVGEDTWKSIMRVQYRQEEENNYDDFDDYVPLHAVGSGDGDTAYFHPDVVYATYWDSYWIGEPIIYDINRVYIAYERLDEEGRYIMYSYCSPVDTNPSYTSDVVYDADDGPGWFPRIDAGIDLAYDWVYNHDDYKVEFVWDVYTEDGVSVYYSYMTLNAISPTLSTPISIDDMEGDDSVANGVPYIDIDPLENRLEDNRENYAHIVWSKITAYQPPDPPDPELWDIEPYYTNSSMIEDSVDVKQVYNTDFWHREGLPVISTYADQTGDNIGTVEFISYSSGVSDYPVYSVDFSLGTGINDPEFSYPKALVSDYPHHSSDAGPPWIHGPSSAIFGEIHTLCAWTEWSDTSAPDIYYNVN